MQMLRSLCRDPYAEISRVAALSKFKDRDIKDKSVLKINKFNKRNKEFHIL